MGVETEILFLFLLPPNMQRGRRKKELLFEFCRALSRLEPTDHTPARKPVGAEPWQSRPMADQPATPHENSKKPRPWLYK